MRQSHRLRIRSPRARSHPPAPGRSAPRADRERWVPFPPHTMGVTGLPPQPYGATLGPPWAAEGCYSHFLRYTLHLSKCPFLPGLQVLPVINITVSRHLGDKTDKLPRDTSADAVPVLQFCQFPPVRPNNLRKTGHPLS